MAIIVPIQKCSSLMASPTISKEEFGEQMNRVFAEAKTRFIELCKLDTSNEETREEEAEMADAINALRNNCLDNFRKYSPGINCYGRDVFRVGDFHVKAYKYFDWEPFDCQRPDIDHHKLYFWIVYNTSNQIICMFNLEKSGNDHVLGLSTEMYHEETESYGEQYPSYMAMKKALVARLRSKTKPIYVSCRSRHT